jgi:hypothetical protein
MTSRLSQLIAVTSIQERETPGEAITPLKLSGATGAMISTRIARLKE